MVHRTRLLTKHKQGRVSVRNPPLPEAAEDFAAEASADRSANPAREGHEEQKAAPSNPLKDEA